MTSGAVAVLPLTTVTCVDAGWCPNTVAVSTYCPGAMPENR